MEALGHHATGDGYLRTGAQGELSRWQDGLRQGALGGAPQSSESHDGSMGDPSVAVGHLGEQGSGTFAFELGCGRWSDEACGGARVIAANVHDSQAMEALVQAGGTGLFMPIALTQERPLRRTWPPKR